MEPTWLKALTVAVVLGGCAPNEYVLRDVDGDGDLEEVAAADPPAPRLEAVPASPGPTSVWVGGRWAWQRNTYVWRPGRYVVARPGYVYAPGYWRKHPRSGWVWVAPRWRR